MQLARCDVPRAFRNRSARGCVPASAAPVWFTRLAGSWPLLTFRCAGSARPVDVAVRWSSPLPPRPCPLPGGPRGVPSPVRSNLPEGRSSRTPRLRSTSEPYRSPWSKPTFSRFTSAWSGTRAGRCACRPSTDMLLKRPLPRRRPVVASAPRVPPSKSRSALVVSHHFGGFLRSWSRGLVASRCRSWGPPCFRFVPTDPKTGNGPRLPRSAGSVPLEELPADSRSASPRPLPPCRSLGSPPRFPQFRCRFHVRRGGRIARVGFGALLRRRVWCAPRPLLTGETRSFLGLVPLQGPFHTTGDPSPTVSVRDHRLPRESKVHVQAPLRTPARWPEPSGGAPSDAEAPGVRTAPEGPVPGPTLADDPRTAAGVGVRVAAWPKPCRRGAPGSGSPAEAGPRNPIRSESLRGFTARAVHASAAQPLGGAEGSPSWARRSGSVRATSMPSKSVRSRSREGRPPQVALLRSGDPRRPS